MCLPTQVHTGRDTHNSRQREACKDGRFADAGGFVMGISHVQGHLLFLTPPLGGHTKRLTRVVSSLLHPTRGLNSTCTSREH